MLVTSAVTIEEVPMADKIIVAFGTKFGSTKEIAETIAVTLSECGLDVDLSPAGDVGSLDGYRAVVLGSAVYMGRWRGDAMRLLRRRRHELAEKDVWLFNSGPVGDQPTGDDEKAQRWLRPPKVRSLATKIGVHDDVVFGGSVAEGGGFIRTNMAKGTPEASRDLRDWDAIRAWARQIAAVLIGDTTGEQAGQEPTRST